MPSQTSQSSTFPDLHKGNDFQRYGCNTNVNMRRYVPSRLPALSLPCHNLHSLFCDEIQSSTRILPKVFYPYPRSSARTIMFDPQNSEQNKNCKSTNNRVRKSLIRSVYHCPTLFRRNTDDEQMALLGNSVKIIRVSSLPSTNSIYPSTLWKNPNPGQHTCKSFGRNYQQLSVSADEHVDDVPLLFNDTSQSSMTIDHDNDSTIEQLSSISKPLTRKQLHVYLPPISY
ncbi:unnamed protein product [Adineta ricciae]|uniref:Uncharacterized protein n=1 Tax=Adineta ricciae TaxID=249248 RepID=A0A816B9X2_ADIRI|nr:unnamed protein product [Adineta ricciae]